MIQQENMMYWEQLHVYALHLPPPHRPSGLRFFFLHTYFSGIYVLFKKYLDEL